ncbi:putative membrane protein YeaQ/YmgE (transglycosylase-associated protein family) [Catenulispora sp. GP43]
MTRRPALARLILSGKQDIPVWLTMLAGLGGAWLGAPAVARYPSTR